MGAHSSDGPAAHLADAAARGVRVVANVPVRQLHRSKDLLDEEHKVEAAGNHEQAHVVAAGVHLCLGPHGVRQQVHHACVTTSVHHACVTTPVHHACVTTPVHHACVTTPGEAAHPPHSLRPLHHWNDNPACGRQVRIECPILHAEEDQL
jgi:hypothetical protein